jgi:hypothetical protein
MFGLTVSLHILPLDIDIGHGGQFGGLMLMLSADA